MYELSFVRSLFLVVVLGFMSRFGLVWLMAVVFCLLGLNSFSFLVFEGKKVSRCLLTISRFQFSHNFELSHVSPSLFLSLLSLSSVRACSQCTPNSPLPLSQ